MKKINVNFLYLILITISLIGCGNYKLNAKQNVKPKMTPHAQKASQTNSLIHEIKSIKEYEQIYSQPQPTIINMYTDWCGACKLMDKDYNQAAKRYGNKVRFYKINVGNKGLDTLVKKNKIEGIPTTLFVKNGKEERRERGTVYGQYLDDTVYRFAYGNDAADKRILARQHAEEKKNNTKQKK